MNHRRWLMTLPILGLLAGAVLALQVPSVRSVPSAADGAGTVQTVHAAEKGLKAGQMDPKSGKKIKYWVAPMDPTYVRDEPGKSPMGMDLVPVYEEAGEEKEPTSTLRIDPVTTQNMGVRFGEVIRKDLVKYIRTLGNVTYDETRIYNVNTKFGGWIEKIHVDFVGQSVRKQQPLFDIYSPELVTAQEEFLLARKQYVAVRDYAEGNVRESAFRLMNASRNRLRYWDLTDRQIADIEKSGQAHRVLTVFSPADGVVTKKNALPGLNVKAGELLYEIADLSTVWVDVDVYESDLPWVYERMPAEMELSYVPGKRFRGRVLFIYPYLNSQTRTAKLRLAFSNPKNELKPGMYANIYLKSAAAKDALVIPQEAVIHSGTRDLVFVSLGKGRFEPRQIRLGAEGNEDEYQVLDGLKEGETIVLSAQFLLDSESRLREAIQKMLEVRERNAPVPQAPAAALKVEGTHNHPSAGDDLDMSGITMDSPPPSNK